MRGLVNRLRGANRQTTSLALFDVFGRVARVLLGSAETIDGVSIVRRKMSRTELAKMVGSSREMVSRVMNQLEARGLIHTRGNGSLVINASLV
jgi:CRP-like cAMP-binding protein